ncbi:MAG: hypothetical protein J6J97_04225 [Akkermansia sp.]|nr:hypothetical protein [Akkermansia sp.]
MEKSSSIPKIIHFVWIGTKPKSELILKCIESWKKFCPDYEIKEWGNDAAEKISNRYMQEALAAKKYAFVSDYLRLYALKTEGGFYFDTDLEITQPLKKEMHQFDFISGYENWKGHISPVTAFMGAKKGCPIISDMLSEYDDISFLINGEPDLTTNTTRITAYFEEKFGLTEPYDKNATTKLNDCGILYPSYIFCTPEKGKENYAIHHFNGSWKVYENWSRKKLLSIWRYRLVLFKNLFYQEEDKLPMREGERWIKKWQINKNAFIALLKKDKKKS